MRFQSATQTYEPLFSGPAGFTVATDQAIIATVRDTPVAAQEASHNSYRSGLTVERLNWEQAGNRYDAWRKLAANSIETNVFNEPEFALSAAQHFAEASRPDFLFVTTTGTADDPGKLVAVFAFEEQRRFGKQIGRLWCPPQMALATPLIDPGHDLAVMDMLQGWLASQYPAMAALMMPAVPVDGRYARLVREHAVARSLAVCEFDRRSRAVLHSGIDTAQRVAHWIGSKRNKETRRLWRRLSERGKLEHVTARATSDVKWAAEYFLALEAQGWKGNRGTALLCDPALATFTRTISRRLAKQHQIEIDALMLDGSPVAMGVVLRSGDEAYFWKTAFKEEFAAYSPGVLMTQGLTSRLIADPAIKFINSCAIPNHPMIDHIWPDRIEMTDLLVAIQGRAGWRFHAAAATEGARRKARALVKSTYHTLKRKT